VIIIGFGLNGRNLARILKEINIPYVILELNPDTVRKMKKRVNQYIMEMEQALKYFINWEYTEQKC